MPNPALRLPRSLGRVTPSVALFAVALLALFTLARTSARGQDGKTAAAKPTATVAAPAPPLEGTGEQMRVIAVICDDWEATRLRENKTGGKKVSAGGPHDSSDIRDYDFEVKEEATVYKIKLTPKKAAIEKIPSPQGVYLLNNSSTFFYEVRRSDFKLVGASMIL